MHRGLGQALMAMAHELQMSENQDPTFSLASNVEIDDHNRNQIGSQSALRFIFFFLVWILDGILCVCVFCGTFSCEGDL